MQFVDGMDLSFVFKSIFPYYTEGFKLKSISREELEGYDEQKEKLSIPLDHSMVYAKLVNDAGVQLGMFSTVNHKTKVLFESEFIFSQLNQVDKMVNHYYLTFAFYLNPDFTFRSFSFDFLYSFNPPDKKNTSKNRYSNHIEVMWEDAFIQVTTDGVDYPIIGPLTIFDVLAEFVFASIYNANTYISHDDHFNIDKILQGCKIDDKKRYRELLSMTSY